MDAKNLITTLFNPTTTTRKIVSILTLLVSGYGAYRLYKKLFPKKKREMTEEQKKKSMEKKKRGEISWKQLKMLVKICVPRIKYFF
jgi:hypothetical protein